MWEFFAYRLAADSRFAHVLRAFHSRNYRLFFAGQSISLIGTWMQQVAMSWLIYRLTGSAMLLGTVGFASQVPTLFLSLFAGVLADRYDRRYLLIATQTLAMAQAIVLGLVVLTGTVQVWHIVALSFILGVVNAFDTPIRQSFVVEMVESKEDLSNAIALNSSMVHAARLIGPSIAAALVATVGEGICFVLNALSYLAVIVAIMAMRTPHTATDRRKHHPLGHQLQEGFSYAYHFKPIRSILLLIALVSFMAMPYTVLVPVFAKDILHGGVHTFGLLMTASGFGALAGALHLAARKSVLGLGRIIVAATVLFALGIIVFALSTSLPLSLAAMVLSGLGAISVIASCNTVLQTILDEDKRGRVMSFFTISFMGVVPFGSFCAGALAGVIGPSSTLLLGGVGCCAGALLFARQLPHIRATVRPIYIRLGILQEDAEEP